MPDGSHDAYVRDVFGADPAHYASQASCVSGEEGDVRPSEIITGASGVDSAYNGLADNAGGYNSYADGARNLAQTNTTDPELGSMTANPMQSPNLGGAFSVHLGIGFLCFNYPADFAHLDDVQASSQPTSAFMQAFSHGLSRPPTILTNLNKNDIVAKLRNAIDGMAHELSPGTQGELVVSFQGHGGDGGFYASDGQLLSGGELSALASQAEAQRVSLTIATTGCNSGAAVPAFQDHAADAVDTHITRNVEGAGQVCSPENDAAAAHLRDQMAHARELILSSGAVGRLNDTLEAAVGGIENPQPGHETDAWDAAMSANADIIRLIQQMQSQFQANFEVGQLPAQYLTPISAAFTTVLPLLTSIQPQTCFDYRGWVHSVGAFQDQVSDAANQIIVALERQSAH